MGRGDKKTKKGKISKGSYGNSRLRKKANTTVAAADEGTATKATAKKK